MRFIAKNLKIVTFISQIIKQFLNQTISVVNFETFLKRSNEDLKNNPVSRITRIGPNPLSV